MDIETTEPTKLNRRALPVYSKGRQFVILLSCFLIQFIVATPFAMGGIYVSLLNTFETNKAETSLVQSLNLGMTHMIGLVAGPLQGVCGPRYLLFIGGLISSIGFGCASFVNSVPIIALFIGILSGSAMAILNVISMSAPPQYFTKAQKEALAISSAGCGLGATVIPVFISWLLNSFGWRGCFLLYAGFNLQVCVFAMAFGTKKPKDIDKSKESLKVQLRKLMTNKLYLIFLVTATLVGMTVSVTNILLMDFALEKGFSKSVSVSFLVSLGVSSFFGRFLFSAMKLVHLSDHVTYVGTTALLGVMTTLLASTNNLYVCHSLVALLGLLLGMYIIGTNITVLNLVGTQLYGFAFGIMTFMAGIGYFSAGPLAGFVADLTSSYNLTFIISGGMSVFVISVYHLATVIDNRRRNQIQKMNQKQPAAAAVKTK